MKNLYKSLIIVLTSFAVTHATRAALNCSQPAENRKLIRRGSHNSAQGTRLPALHARHLYRQSREELFPVHSIEIPSMRTHRRKIIQQKLQRSMARRISEPLSEPVNDYGPRHLFNFMHDNRCLLESAKEKNINGVRVALTNNAFVNAQDIDGYTALHYAALNGDIDMVQLLLAHGAETDLKTIKNQATPIQIATMHGYNDIAHIIHAHETSKREQFMHLLLATQTELNVASRMEF
jgi:hypothetical protein